MSNLNTFLQTLNQLSEKNTFNVYIPSLNREVKFKPLTTWHQKLFYTCISDNSLFRTKFIITTFEIIKDLCTEPELLNKFNVVDRLIILLSLRKNTLGSRISLLKDNTNYEVDFDQILQKTNSLALPQNELLQYKNIQVELQVPLMKDQYNLEKELRETEPTLLADISELAPSILINELCKYIKQINIKEEDRTVALDYDKLTYKERIIVVENLPAEILLNLKPFAEKTAELLSQVLTISTDNNSEITFELDVDFFLDS